FFFQAEERIRDGHVTGVQTCALPILIPLSGQLWFDRGIRNTPDGTPSQNWMMRLFEGRRRKPDALWFALIAAIGRSNEPDSMTRSEERRVGKECRCGGAPYNL